MADDDSPTRDTVIEGLRQELAKCQETNRLLRSLLNAVSEQLALMLKRLERAER